ncbi:hypothetical protein F9C28_17575 [Shimwellia pseudoproteus]|uniref:hypothetical protein n=1 Tax=Shimwellia pseudoproteus TaxID=570012 RepID=UPI0018EA7C8E|nr:hypothetical protein [Shimwellia pseudoproteus]MBJ3816672.1 hypothetical protein [Shimwellia pseudoproteus]
MQLTDDEGNVVKLPDDGRVVLSVRNGKVVSVRDVHTDEFIASLNALFDMAKLAGFSINKPDGVKR